MVLKTKPAVAAPVLPIISPEDLLRDPVLPCPPCSSLPSQSAASSGSSQEQVSNLTHQSFWKVQKNQLFLVVSLKKGGCLLSTEV